jgi:hypothetical protein
VSDVMLHGILNMPPGIWDNSDIHKAQRHDAYKQASKRILELEAELSFYANCSYSSSWVTGDKNHAMEDSGDRASNYLFKQAGKVRRREKFNHRCNTAVAALKDQG